MSKSKPQKKIVVYVLNMRGEPLMPCSPAKARKLLKAKKAIVKYKEPFTIQLKVEIRPSLRAQSLLPFNLKLPVVKIVSLSLWGLTQVIHTLV